MAIVKIRDLDAGYVSNNNDYFVVALDSGTTVKVPYSALVTALMENSIVEGNNITISDTTEQGGIKKYSIAASNGITTSAVLTLSANGWSNNSQTVSFTHDTSLRNVIDITLGEGAAWNSAGVYLTAETANDLTFGCSSVPEIDLTFKVTSMPVTQLI